MWDMTYLIENRAAEADMNVMSKTDRAMRILVKLLRNWISFLLRTNIERPLPKRPIRTVMGVTTTSMILAKVNSMVDEVGDLLDLQCHTQKRKHWLSRSHSAILLYLHFTSPPNNLTGKAIFDKKNSCRYRVSQIEMDKVNWLWQVSVRDLKCLRY